MNNTKRYSELTKSLLGKNQLKRQALAHLSNLVDFLHQAAKIVTQEITVSSLGLEQIPDKGPGTAFSIRWFEHNLTFMPIDYVATPPDWACELAHNKNEAARLVVVLSCAENGSGSHVIQEFFVFSDGQYVSKGIVGLLHGSVCDEQVSLFPLALFEALDKNVTTYHLPKEELRLDLGDSLKATHTPIGFRLP